MLEKIFWNDCHAEKNNYYIEAKKSSNTEFANFFGETHKFLGVRDREKVFLQKLEIFLEIEKIWVARNFDLKSSMGSYFQQQIPQKRSFLSLRRYGAMRRSPVWRS